MSNQSESNAEDLWELNPKNPQVPPGFHTFFVNEINNRRVLVGDYPDGELPSPRMLVAAIAATYQGECCE